MGGQSMAYFKEVPEDEKEAVKEAGKKTAKVTKNQLLGKFAGGKTIGKKLVGLLRK